MAVPESLREFLSCKLELQKATENSGLEFLNLEDRQEKQAFDSVLNSSQSSRTSSIHSIASEVSEAYLNDVEQSAMLLVETLQRKEKELELMEKRKMIFWLRPFCQLAEPVKDLISVMRTCEDMVIKLQPELDTIGFRMLPASNPPNSLII